MLRSTRVCAWIGALALLGCTAFEEHGANTPSRTDGITMSLSIARPSEQAYELFRVTREGDLEYGGGMRAFNGSTSWSGAMTTDEIQSFLTLLNESGWCDTRPPTDDESTVRVRIELRCTERRRTWSIRGAPESVARMRELLEPIARRRFEPDLDRLPEASEIRAKRREAEAQERNATDPSTNESDAPAAAPAPRSASEAAAP